MTLMPMLLMALWYHVCRHKWILLAIRNTYNGIKFWLLKILFVALPSLMIFFKTIIKLEFIFFCDSLKIFWSYPFRGNLLLIKLSLAMFTILQTRSLRIFIFCFSIIHGLFYFPISPHFIPSFFSTKFSNQCLLCIFHMSWDTHFFSSSILLWIDYLRKSFMIFQVFINSFMKKRSA